MLRQAQACAKELFSSGLLESRECVFRKDSPPSTKPALAKRTKGPGAGQGSRSAAFSPNSFPFPPASLTLLPRRGIIKRFILPKAAETFLKKVMVFFVSFQREQRRFFPQSASRRFGLFAAAPSPVLRGGAGLGGPGPPPPRRRPPPGSPSHCRSSTPRSTWSTWRATRTKSAPTTA